MRAEKQDEQDTKMIDILNRYTGAVLYHDEAAQTMTDAVLSAVKSRANLSGADLSGAILSGAKLSGADLGSIYEDLTKVLDFAKPEVPELYKALVDGRINGQDYVGGCACLVGTIANARHCSYVELDGIQPNGARPAERWFLAITPGDTPENNPVSAVTRDWLLKYMSEHEINIPVREIIWR